MYCIVPESSGNRGEAADRENNAAYGNDSVPVTRRIEAGRL